MLSTVWQRKGSEGSQTVKMKPGTGMRPEKVSCLALVSVVMITKAEDTSNNWPIIKHPLLPLWLRFVFNWMPPSLCRCGCWSWSGRRWWRWYGCYHNDQVWEDVRSVRGLWAKDTRSIPDESSWRELARTLLGLQRVRGPPQPLLLLP